MNSHAQWNPVLMMVAVNFGLATVNLLLKKILDQGLNPLGIITYRQSISAIFVAPIAYFWERKSRYKLNFLILCQLFFSAFIGVTLAQYFFLLGLEYTTATFSCAFTNMVPVGTFLLALTFGLEKVNLKSLAGRAKVLGTIVCIGGAMLLALYKGKPLTDSHIPDRANMMVSTKKKEKCWAIGSMFLTLGILVWSSWFVMQARISKRYPCQYSSTAITSFFVAIQSAIMSLIIDRDLPGLVLKGKLEIVTVTYAGMVGSGLCYVGMSWCVKRRGPVFTSAFTPFIQIFVGIFDFSILHEPIYLGSVIGSALVIIGLYVLLWGKSKEIEECDPMKQAQVADQDDQSIINAVSHVIPIPVGSTNP